MLPLGVLKAADVLHLLRDTFNATATEARELAQVLHTKSGGNPLYLSQFLPYLCDEELISFDYRAGKWVWDLAGIQQEGVTQDVLELLKLRLKALPQGVRMILATAACIGSSFEASKVALAAQRSLVEVLGYLATLTREGLIVTNDHELQVEPHRQLEYQSPSQFRFVHDRVQEAGFDCVPEEAKQDFRLQIGRRLLAGLVWDDERPPPVYVLTNLNSAWQLLSDAEEKQRVAEINLVAGRKARRALAYQDALGYISVGLGLLGSRCWSRTYDLAFALHSEAFECEYLTANFERAEILFAELIANARSKLDKARVYRTKVLLDTSEARYEQALKVGIEALKLFGLSYPRKPSKLHLLAQLMLVRLQMRGRKPHDLLQAKVLNDPEKLAVLRLLVALIPTALVLSRDLFVLTGVKIVNYSLRHGIAPASATGFVLYGFTLGSAMDDFKHGYEFGRLAVELAERDKDPSVLCKVLYLFILIKVWRDPRDEVFPLVERVRRLALEAGDHQFAAMAISSTITPRVISRGNELQEILRLCEEHRPFIEQSKIADMVDMLKMCTNHSLALQGRTACPYSLTDGSYDEIEAELRYQRSGGRIPSFIQYLVRLQLACLFGRAKEAQILCDKLDPIVRSGTGSGYSQIADYYLFRGLVASDALSRARGRAKRLHRKALRHSLARLRLFAENNPLGFRQNEELLKAEAARVAGRLHTSLKHYNCAIELADAGGFIPVFVLANERAALFCLGDGQRRLASWYLACARAACEKWGATAKVAWLNREYAEVLLNASLPVARATNGTTPPTEIRSTRRQGSSFDIAAALHASRIMASGETTESVLTHLMQVMRVQAGAETAHLLVLEGGTLRLEASATVDSGVMLFPSPSTDVASSAFSSAIVNHVLHTGHDLLLVDATADARFAQCSYVARRRPKSVLCSALRHQSEVLGVIYLEHAQVAGAFDGQKLEWLRLLATEVGLTVWSARLSRYREYVHKFAPAAVAKEIDSNPASPNLEAKDSDVTILFGDLAGYTRITEQMERRQLDQFMNRILSRFVDEIHRYEGTLLEIRGDELFVLFGDEDHSKHVRKAASAALALSRTAASLQDELSGAHPPIILNMGLNSGIASVGLKAVEAASGARWRYGASGTVVNIAARVRELARDGSILMTADSALRLENEFVLEDQGEHALKNVQNRIHIYRLIGQLQASTS